MNKETAKQLLQESITNLQNRRDQITMADFEAEVINNACLYILKNQKDKMRKGDTIESMFMGALDAYQDFLPIAKAFTDGAMEVFPGYTIKEAMAATMGIQQNLTWDGMWDFLRDYFQKNHGIEIDDVETISSIFYSNKHKRYENGILTSESDVERTINLNFINDKEELLVSIAPSLSPKKSYRISSSSYSPQYKGYDPDYLFSIAYDRNSEIISFTLEMPNRSLKIIYFE
jgi:hypothetical protein